MSAAERIPISMADMKIFWCDVCGKKRDKRFEGEIVIGNGNRKIYAEVCDHCLTEVEKTIGELLKQPIGLPVNLSETVKV